ncbi:MAG TPA: hypothetical protein VII09_00810, partial [Opitutaceae bacterium]
GRWPIAAAWIIVLGLDVACAIRGLPPAEFRAGALVLLPVAAYLLSHQLVHRNSRWRAPKEVCVAVLLGAGAAVFVASRPGADLPAMAIPLTLFVLLCFANCALISVWENEVDRMHGQTSLALQYARAAAVSAGLPWVIAAIAVAVGIGLGSRVGAAASCAAASGLLLGLVNRAEPRIGRVRARVLADVALMTPAACLLVAFLA